MKKISQILIVVFTLISGVLSAQEADVFFHPDHRTKFPTLNQLQKSYSGTTHRISITDIQDPSGGNYVDLYYNVYARLYYKTIDIKNSALQEKIDIDVDLGVYGYQFPGGAPSSFTTTKTLSVDPSQDYSVIAFRFGKDQVNPYDLYDLDSASVSLQSSEYDFLDTNILNSIHLELYVEMGRYYTDAVQTISPSFYSESSNSGNNLKEDEAMAYWDKRKGSIVYELEWVFIPANDPSSVSNLEYNFTENAVRVQTDKNFFPISMIRQPGFLVIRGRSKRPIINQRQTTVTGHFEYSRWNLNDFGSVSTSSSSVLTINNPSTDDLNTLNWQSITSYGIGSRKKEVVNFFDGSQRERQTNTLITDFSGTKVLDTTGSNSVKVENYGNQLISAEKHYDYYGNEAIAILPSPIVGTGNFGYQRDLNEFGNRKLKKNDYDSLGYKIFPELNKLSNGAVQYYSDNNQLLGVDPKMDYIADAEGYPYSRTEYAADGSLRPKIKYNVGKAMALDSSKNERYFYAKPTTSDLERLFGSNVGKANFYKKNILIDANGSMNISYLDNKDRVVATSIAGIPELRANMNKVATDSTFFTEDLLKTGAEQFYESTGSLELVYPVFATTSATYEFDYGFNLEPYEACSNVNICFDCRYSLVFQILDSENNLLVEAEDTLIEFDHQNCTTDVYVLDQITYNPNGIASLNGTTIEVFFNAKKQYTIVKKLSLIKDEINIDAQLYLDSSNCDFYDLEHFQILELDSTDFTVCETDYSVNDPCKEIEDRLKLDFIYPIGEFVKEATDDSLIAEFVYNQLLKVAGCHELQTISRTQFSIDFNTHFGLSTSPTFADYKDEYIDYLIHFHPSYCQLPACRRYKNKSSLQFDEALNVSETLEDFVVLAKGLGLMSQADSLFFDIDTTISSNVFTLLNSNYILFEYDSTMKALRDNGIFTNFLNPIFAADNISYYEENILPKNRNCNDPNVAAQMDPFIYSYFNKYSGACSTPAYPAGGPFSISEISKLFPGGNVEVWKIYKTLYLNAKSRMVNDLLKSLVCFQRDNAQMCVPGGDYRFPWFSRPIASQYLNYDHFTSSSYRSNFFDIDDLEAFADSIGDVVSSGKTVAKQVYALLAAENCMSLIDSMNFVNQFDSALFMCNPFEYLDTVGGFSCAEGRRINIASVLAPFRTYYPDTVYSCSPAYKPHYNCSDLNKANDAYELKYGSAAIPYVPSAGLIDINNLDQKYYANWLNVRLGLNLSFRDYFDMANSCYVDGDTTMFGTPISWDDPANIQAIKAALLTPPASDSTVYLITFSTIDLFTIINNSISGFTLNPATDYLGFGETDLTNSQYDLYYLENGQTRHNNLLDSLNWVFAEIKDSLEVLPVIENLSLAHCARVNVAQYSSVANASNIIIDRAYRYSNGTVWVRLLNASDSSFYNDYYYHYEPYNKLYQLDEITSFSAIEAVFDQEELHYVRLTLSGIGAQMLASTSNTIATAHRINQVELNDYQSMPTLPLDEACEDRKYFDAKIMAEVRYLEYLDGLKEQFKVDYISFCTNQSILKAINNQYLDMRYESSERQFTLYYYDQADNLVMTVPPDGVANFNYTSTVANNIAAYRNGTYGAVLPPHSKQTVMKYNSDNQIIEQSTPNAGLSKYWHDKAGRITLSQNAKQAVTNTFSYIFYDPIGRIKETGYTELNELAGKSWAEIHAFISLEILNGSAKSLEELVTGDGRIRREITQTFYDSLVLSSNYGFEQKNLLGRVSTKARYSLIKGKYAPELYYKLNGDALDASGNQQHGNPNGPVPATGKDAVAGHALYFDGNNDRIVVPNSPYMNHQELTVSVWVNAPKPNRYRMIAGKYPINPNRSWVMYTGSTSSTYDKLQVIVCETGTTGSSTSKYYRTSMPVFDNQWHHLAFTFKDGDLKIYVDGLEDPNPTKVWDAPITSIYQNTADLLIGSFIGGTGNHEAFFRGTIDEFVMFDHALNAQQIHDIYSSFPQANEEVPKWEYATHYNYDLRGSVKSVLNDYYQAGTITRDVDRFKRLDYVYDDFNGNLLRLYYQLGEEDAFYHRYNYDAENRITEVKTSKDGLIWDRDASYTYYQHGPLARTELGEHNVQGMDYSYTLQGWLKTVNGSFHEADIGKDKSKNNIFAQDAFGYTLQYNQEDYKSIANINAELIASNTGSENSDLYNRNISAIIAHKEEQTYGKAYTYDQLNRLNAMTEREIKIDSLKWGGLLPNGNASYYQYDENGNLTTLQRLDGESGNLMDDFTYNYIGGTDKLSSVDDNVSPTLFDNDIDQQVANNYQYDPLGNLIVDSLEGICEIRWHPNGKVSKIIRDFPSRDRADLAFEYDANDKRVKKTISFVENGEMLLRSTYYVRDAQGNVIATYEERDCDYYEANDSLGLFYYQYSEGYGGYTAGAVEQLDLTTVIDYLFYNFQYKDQLADQAYLNLSQIPNIRDSILKVLDIEAYLSLYPDAVERVINHDHYTYANHLFIGQSSAFIAAMNEDHLAWIEYMKLYNKVGNFYSTMDQMYTSVNGFNNNAQDFMETHKDLVQEQFGNMSLMMQMLNISASQYSDISDCMSSHSLAVNTMQSWVQDLYSLLAGNVNNQQTYDLINQINAKLLAINFDPAEIDFFLQGLNPAVFYNALGWLPSTYIQKLNAVLHHMIYQGASSLSTSSLLDYKPLASLDLTADTNGDFLYYYIQASVARPAVIGTFISYGFFNSFNMNQSAIYFSGSSLKPYALTIFTNYAASPGTSFYNHIKDAVIELAGATKDALAQTEDLAHLINYYRNYHAYDVIVQNYHYDSLNSSLSHIAHFTPFDYAQDLIDNLGVSFDSLGGCNPHIVYTLVDQYYIYGAELLGTVNANKKSKDEDNLYSRKLRSKEYQLKDHLGSVMATVSDKKLHPEELVNDVQNVDTSLGYVADVIGRYDYYPYGMMIEDRVQEPDQMGLKDSALSLNNSGWVALSKYYKTGEIIPELTVEAWVKTTDAGGGFTNWAIIDFDRSEFFNLFISAGRVGFSTSDGTVNDMYSVGTVNDGEWHHIAAVFANGEKIIYIDGVEDSRINAHTTTNYIGNRNIRYGILGDGSEATTQNGNRNNQYYVGEMDEIRLWHIQRTEAEIQSSMYASLNGSESGLEAYYTFNNVEGSEVKDASGHGFDGVAYGTYDFVENVPLPRRGKNGHMFGFNGMERDDELSGNGNSYDFGARIYSPRIARFFSTDPREEDFPFWSPYIFAANNPIRFIDVNGEGPGDGDRDYSYSERKDLFGSIDQIFVSSPDWTGVNGSGIVNFMYQNEEGEWVVERITDGDATKPIITIVRYGGATGNRGYRKNVTNPKDYDVKFVPNSNEIINPEVVSEISESLKDNPDQSVAIQGNTNLSSGENVKTTIDGTRIDGPIDDVVDARARAINEGLQGDGINESRIQIEKPTFNSKTTTTVTVHERNETNLP